MKRVLIITSIYPPDNAPESRRMSLLARELRGRGYQVHVIAGFPHYPSGVIPEGYRRRLLVKEEADGVPVVRCPIYIRPEPSASSKAMHWLSFLPSALLASVVLPGRFNAILTIWPPFSGQIAAWLTALMRSDHLVFDIQDIYPDTALELGVMSEGWIFKAAQRLEGFLYRQADRIVVISKGFEQNLLNKGVPQGVIRRIPNWVDVPHFQHGCAARVRRELTPDHINVLYSGNIGRAQGLQTIVDAAGRLGTDERLRFFIIGDGAERRGLQQYAEQVSPNNVAFLGPRAFDQIPDYLAAADVLIVHLRRNPLYRVTIPSKVAEYIAASKPIVAAIEGDALKLVTEAGCGIAVPPEDPDSLATAIKRLADQPALRAKLAQAGSDFARRHLSMDVLLPTYADVIDELIGDGPRVRGTA